MTHIQRTIHRARIIGLYKPDEVRALARSARIELHNARVHECRIQMALNKPILSRMDK